MSGVKWIFYRPDLNRRSQSQGPLGQPRQNRPTLLEAYPSSDDAKWVSLVPHWLSKIQLNGWAKHAGLVPAKLETFDR